MNLDLKQVLAIARRRWWLVLLMMVLSGGAAYASASRETKLYSASATMMVMPGPSVTGTIDYNSLLVTERLADTYPLLITSNEMQRRVADALGMGSIPGSISADVSGDSELIIVSVVDNDPQRAALVANTVVSEFQKYIADQAEGRASAARAGIDDQIAALQSRLDEIDARIAELDSKANENDGAVQRQIEDLSQERATINSALVDLNTQSVTIGAQIIASSARVEPAEAAVAPGVPFEPRPRRSAVLGIVVGLMLSVGLVALLEYLDNTIKPGHNLQAMTGGPLLATVPVIHRLERGRQQVYAITKTHSSAAEAIRLLRTNLEFASASAEIRTITVTSPGQGEGKSTTAANLAAVLAQAGLETVLIDADLRKPTQSTIFGVGNASGLSTLLSRPETKWQDVAREVGVSGLQLIPSGPIPPNASDLVGSRQFETLLATINAQVDRIVIDTPPILAASDALAIAAHTDGMVLVAHSHRTRIDAVRHATDAVKQGGIRLIGIVLNRQKGQHGASIYGDYYGYRPVSFTSNGTAHASQRTTSARRPDVLAATPSQDGLS